jgi:uncharacterized protein (DUF433 family)
MPEPENKLFGDIFRERSERAIEALRAFNEASRGVRETLGELNALRFTEDADAVLEYADRLESRLSTYHAGHELLPQVFAELFAVYQLGMPQLAPEMAQARAIFADLVPPDAEKGEWFRLLPGLATDAAPARVASRLADVLIRAAQELSLGDERLSGILHAFDERIILPRESDAESQPVSTDPPDWREHIESHPDVLSGKPIVKGTRIPAAFLLELLAAGWTERDLLEGYPDLTQDDLHAVWAYASEVVAGNPLHPTPR